MKNDTTYKSSVLKPVLLTFMLVLATSVAGIAWINSEKTSPPSVIQIFEAEERFEFEVRYGFIRLGEVHVASKDTVVNGIPHKKIQAVMLSNRNLPFVGYREYHYNSLLQKNDTTFYSSYFWVDNLHRERFPENSFEFDYEQKIVISQKEDGEVDTLQLNGPSDGGPALFMIGRLHAGSEHSIQYPVFVNNEENMVSIHFSGETDFVRSPAFNNDRIQVYKSEGNASFEGPFGYTGRFTSTHYTGSSRVPIEARASVWIGNVLIRLTSYETNL